MNTRSTTIKAMIIASVVILFACKDKVHYEDTIYEKPAINPNPEIKNLTPEESLKTLYLPKGYRIELVASEPLIHEPVSIAWDGNGKLYVAQMNTYMQDADATNENEPWSQISILKDTNADGRMDKSTVFIDSLVLPRIMLALDDRLIVGETFNRNLYSYCDINKDGIADEGQPRAVRRVERLLEVDRHRSVALAGHLVDRKSTRLNSSHPSKSRMPSSA